MNKIILRLLYGLLFALPLMLLTYALAQASSPQQAQQPPSALSCPACHETFQTTWEKSKHGTAASDPVFKKSWEDQGKPGACLSCHVTGYNPDTGTWKSDGITCEACHDAATANHPMKPMAADRSAKMCGTCHQETYFEWQASVHRQKGLDCVGCHDPHSTGLIAADTADQCASCHRERASNFAHTQHSKVGLSCADCHLKKLSDPVEGHSRRDHSFNVSLSTCNSCHAYQMHDPAEVHTDNPTPQPVVDTLAAVDNVTVATESKPVNPLGFATLSGVFGLAAGAILAPWIERLLRNRKNKDQ